MKPASSSKALARVSSLLTLVAAVAGCTVESKAGGGGGGGAGGEGAGESGSGEEAALGTDACLDACANKASTCAGAGAQASAVCQKLCDGTVTASQMACLSGKSCEELAGAENAAEVCPKTSSSPAPGGGSGSGSVLNGDGAKPPSLTVTGSFGASKPITALDPDKKIVAVFMSGRATSPSVSPAASSTPQIHRVPFVLSAPSAGACTATITWQLTPSELSFSMSGSDALPSTDCVKLAEAIAKDGIEGSFAAVPYLTGGTADVTVRMKP